MVKPTKKINIKEYVSDNVIDLSMSNVTEVPAKEIAAFKRCTTLDLSRNKIVELPTTFGLLTHLTRLDLSSNQIKMLPAEIGLLINLRHLDLYNNEMIHLPLEMSKLKQLRYLDVKGNPLSDAIRNLLGPCLTSAECAKAARKMVEFLSTVKQQVDIDRELLRKSRLQAAAQEKETIANGESDSVDAELVSAQPAEPEKAAKKPKPPSKKMKKLLEQQSLENEAKLVSNGKSSDKQSGQKSTNGFARFALLMIMLVIVLPLLVIGVCHIYDSDCVKIKQLVQDYIPTPYQTHFHLALDHMRQHATNYGKWLKALWYSNDSSSM